MQQKPRLIPRLDKEADVADIFADLNRIGLALDVGIANWKDTGKDSAELPETKAYLGHNGKTLLIRFDVRESQVRAVFDKPQDPVCEDSCVEIFLSPRQSDGSPWEPGGYYNLECNAIGTCLYCFGPDRHERSSADLSVVDSIKTWPSLGRNTFEILEGPVEWRVDIALPFTAFFKHSGEGLPDFAGACVYANLYKCADGLARPHYLSWAPINTETPDFHQPQFFLPLLFE